jgi:hypothetical protein
MRSNSRNGRPDRYSSRNFEIQNAASPKRFGWGVTPPV